MNDDIRVPTAEYTLCGKKYTLIANMNVLADVQEAFDGDMREALSRKHTLKSGLVIGAAMLNEACAISGDRERFTPDDLGRKIKANEAVSFAEIVTGLLCRAVMADEEPGEKDEAQDSKN